MKIPKKLKIGGHTYDIKFDSEIDAMGDCSTKKNLIRIDGSIPKDQQEATLIHEIFHALNTTFGSTMTEHALIDSLAEQMYQVLSDNKLLR